jgi:hypothetical protein
LDLYFVHRKCRECGRRGSLPLSHEGTAPAATSAVVVSPEQIFLSFLHWHAWSRSRQMYKTPPAQLDLGSGGSAVRRSCTRDIEDTKVVVLISQRAESPPGQVNILLGHSGPLVSVVQRLGDAI